MLWNKKGFGLGMTDWGSWIVFPLILLVFFYLFNSSFKTLEFKISDTAANTENQISLINILKTPVKVSGQDMLISDLIAIHKSADNEEYKVQLEENLVPILNSVFKNICSTICINNEVFIESTSCTYFESQCGSFSVEIPNYVGVNNKLEVSIYVIKEIELQPKVLLK